MDDDKYKLPDMDFKDLNIQDPEILEILKIPELVVEETITIEEQPAVLGEQIKPNELASYERAKPTAKSDYGDMNLFHIDEEDVSDGVNVLDPIATIINRFDVNDFTLESVIKSTRDKELNKPVEFTHVTKSKASVFNDLVAEIRDFFDPSMESSTNFSDSTDKAAMGEWKVKQRDAIIGMENAVDYFKEKIESYIMKSKKEATVYPDWYDSLVEAVFQEIWGLAGIYCWVKGQNEDLTNSSSAKIIGDNIYFLIKGKMVLQPQKISANRRMQLIKALLLSTPDKVLTTGTEEVYLIDGTRVTIFAKDKVKENLHVIVFRKYIVDNYSFDLQVSKGTIPEKAIPLFKEMIKVGFNIAFVGPVRTAKTTFLTAWEMCERQDLEGILIETDPEVPMHKLKPLAPMAQFISQDKEASKILAKAILRSDADYITVGEARDGVMLDAVIKAISKGTRRVKITFHLSEPTDFPYEVAEEIYREYGGNLEYLIKKIAKGFHYIFSLVQLQDKSQKRLNAIYEIEFNRVTYEITIHTVCLFDYIKGIWYWNNPKTTDKLRMGMQEDIVAYRRVDEILDELVASSPEWPVNEVKKVIPFYSTKPGGN